MLRVIYGFTSLTIFAATSIQSFNDKQLKKDTPTNLVFAASWPLICCLAADMIINDKRWKIEMNENGNKSKIIIEIVNKKH